MKQASFHLVVCLTEKNVEIVNWCLRFAISGLGCIRENNWFRPSRFWILKSSVLQPDFDHPLEKYSDAVTRFAIFNSIRLWLVG